MDYLQIKRVNSLNGNIKISGAKNASLPLIAMTILAINSVHIKNLPQVADIKTLLKLLSNLGAQCDFRDDKVVVDTSTLTQTKATYDIVKTMRASILVLGPILARFGHCEVSLPGGCAIGQRPVDLHLKALEHMGAKISIEAGYIQATAPNGLKGCDIIFDKITVTGTANIVMAAALASGNTTITNAAREPEVVQLCEILNASGVQIDGIGTAILTVHGTNGKLINIEEFAVIPDRIEAGTYLCAGAISRSELTLSSVEPKHLGSVLAKLEEMGSKFTITESTITIHPSDVIKPIKIVTQEYPAFPTDMQAQFLALATQANGTSIIEERLFENRFMHVSELQRMGADISLNGHVATITGGTKLSGTDVMATDLRASSALVLAGLVADGTTNVHRIYHLDRGYDALEKKLEAVGADVRRLKE
ncbi:UDP-N-acetylglucosamine 1-carboxyvinyltransferase [Sulfurimonas gotlandica GD1]|uniref:UDP-N-acetylglucosamine 1-carboxyvinyltransferase n=1 Tax=Sulfurimonas gotlandica (strain DSM 19862 / JCM 16533 / GD1) TaxID=929558 RepID=B6BIT6_SULGG|nr:UDP-N-acetylglucosamine 1-carboxyvinyltransferase [Sulfurimonas gotlandica]EDZ63264.1 UDP-N-acetylglucosamine 1-carboxyvinyltransferase [Sulfurimonas gotlandica GD1]EHP30446.1 UDP-N-acetylglucosamine 1-carboxyvinyltransferase [Sulfurimonas gotlandica GD1]